MKRCLALSTLLILAMPAHAQLARSFSEATYTGLGVSKLSADFDNLGDAVNLDAIAGFHLTPELPWGQVNAELNVGVTVSPGKNKGQPSSSSTTTGGGLLGGGTTSNSSNSGHNTASTSDLSAYDFSIQAVYHTPGRLYGAASVGYTLINTNIQEISDRGRSAASFGGGIGFRFGANTAGVELLYTRVSQDLQTIGIRLTY